MEHPSDYVNDVAQVGGDHYSRGADYQHWDWVSEINLPYLEACATKYLTRWRDKDGIKDLKKAVSYIEKLFVLYDTGGRTFIIQHPNTEAFLRFCKANNVIGPEQIVCWLLTTWRTKRELTDAITIAEGIIATAQEAVQPPEGVMGGKGSGTAYHAALQGSEVSQTTKESK